MASQPKMIRIPLLEISERVEREAQSGDLPQGLKRISEVEIPVFQNLPECWFALEVPDIFWGPAESGMALGVFGLGKDEAALDDVFVLGLEGQTPFFQRVIKNDARPGSSSQGESSQALSSSRAKNPRKSFMTPTPLHIPKSRVSPIPDSSHEMIYLKGLSADDSLKVVPFRDVVWKYPLISVMQNPSA